METAILGLMMALIILQGIVLAVVMFRRHPAPTTGAAATQQPDGSPADVSMPHLKTEQVEELGDHATSAFEHAVDAATQQFGSDLAGTSQRLNNLIIKLTTDVVEGELAQYKDSLAAARGEALKALAGMQTSIEQRQQELQVDVDAALQKRREFLIERLDHKLGEAVTAYVVESLGQGADLGAQRVMLLDALERHKDDLKRDLADAA